MKKRECSKPGVVTYVVAGAIAVLTIGLIGPQQAEAVRQYASAGHVWKPKSGGALSKAGDLQSYNMDQDGAGHWHFSASCVGSSGVCWEIGGGGAYIDWYPIVMEPTGAYDPLIDYDVHEEALSLE